MPTYEYRCNSCGEHVEVFQSFSDEPLSTCGLCGGDLRRVFHPVGIVFKGSGFYSTDSKNESSRSSGKSSKASSATAASAEKTSERSSEDASSASGSAGSENPKSSSDREAKIA